MEMIRNNRIGIIASEEKKFEKIDQSKHIIGLGGHIEFSITAKWANFDVLMPINILAKFGFIWPSAVSEKILFNELKTMKNAENHLFKGGNNSKTGNEIFTKFLLYIPDS